jgi:hypothetical protein
MAFETKALVIGESADRWIAAGVRELVGSVDCVENVDEVLAMHTRPEFILLTGSLDLQNDTGAKRFERAVSGLDCEIKASYAKIQRVFTEARARDA